MLAKTFSRGLLRYMPQSTLFARVDSTWVFPVLYKPSRSLAALSASSEFCHVFVGRIDRQHPVVKPYFIATRTRSSRGRKNSSDVLIKVPSSIHFPLYLLAASADSTRPLLTHLAYPPKRNMTQSNKCFSYCLEYRLLVCERAASMLSASTRSGLMYGASIMNCAQKRPLRP